MGHNFPFAPPVSGTIGSQLPFLFYHLTKPSLRTVCKKGCPQMNETVKVRCAKLNPNKVSGVGTAPMISIMSGNITLIVCIATLYTLAQSCIAANSRSDIIPCSTESVLISSIGILSPVMDFAGVRNRTKCGMYLITKLLKNLTTAPSVSPFSFSSALIHCCSSD